MKHTGVTQIQVFGGPMDGFLLNCHDTPGPPRAITKTVPASRQWDHKTRYELRCLQMPSGTMNLIYIATTVTAVAKPSK